MENQNGIKNIFCDYSIFATSTSKAAGKSLNNLENNKFTR